jgi:hypothetical protein
VKFNAANKSSSGTFLAAWQIGDPNSTNIVQLEPMSLAPDTFHEFQIPPNLFDDKGVLTIVFLNANSTALLFPLEDGMEVLYPEGGFAMNFARGLGIIFCWMALLAALGLAAASFLSFPVATFFSLAMLTVVLSSGTLAETVENGSVGVGNDEKGIAGHSVADVVLIPMFKGILAVVSLTKNISPIDLLSSGRAISWTDLGMAFGQIVLLLGGIISVMRNYSVQPARTGDGAGNPMNARVKKINPLFLLAAVLLFSSGQLEKSLNRDRAQLGLTISEPLQNAPPLLAFTTVALGGFRGLISNFLWIAFK